MINGHNGSKDPTELIKKYTVIYADPPWTFKNKNTGGSLKSGSESVYPVMSVDDICCLPIKNISHNDSILFMWWVGSQPREALSVVDAWGFTLKTMTGFSWYKKTKHGKPFFGMGFWTRAGSENCLIATRGDIARVSASIRSVFAEDCVEHVIEEHSKKPGEIRNRIVQLCGDVNKIELFARQKTEGWDVWGNEVSSDVNLFPLRGENA